jgi:hypothetical protein
MQINRFGVDSLYLASRGMLPTEVLSRLAEAKAQAVTDRRDISIAFDGTDIRALVLPHGLHGGYAYIFDTGPLGARFACRESSDKRLEWNFFVKPHATTLLCRGFDASIRNVRDTITALGGSMVETSPNRIDYAIDIRADGFELDIARFIAHPKARRRPNWEERDLFRPGVVIAGREIKTVTIGTLPGWEICVYDKTTEARVKQQPHWFAAWKIDPADKCARIWRLELSCLVVKPPWRFQRSGGPW